MALTGVARFAYRGVAGRQVGGGSVLVPSPPEAPYRTATTTVSTRVTAQERTGPWARAGIVVRNDLADPGSAGFLNLAVTPDNGYVLSSDSDGNGTLDTFRSTTGTATVASAVAVSDAGLIASAANGGSGAAGMVRFTVLLTS